MEVYARRQRSKRAAFIALAVLIASAGVVVAFLYGPYILRLPVTVMLNGQEVQVPLASPVGEIAEEHLDRSDLYGNLLAVDDSILDEYGGEPPIFTLREPGEAAFEAASDVSITSPVSITVDRGEDVVENIAEEEVDRVEPGPQIRTGSGPIGRVISGQPGITMRFYGELSGIEVEVVETQEMRPPEVRFIDVTQNDPKFFALTFDDGPNPDFTPDLLDLLAASDVSATFFVTGAQVSQHPELARRIVEEGHQIANHSYGHADYRTLSYDALRYDVNKAQDAIEAATGERPTWIRPPYGAVNKDVYTRFITDGLTVALWNIDPQDWLRPGADAIADHTVRHAKPGSVVVLHDGGGERSQTIQATATMIARLQQAGFTLVTMEEMYEAHNAD